MRIGWMPKRHTARFFGKEKGKMAERTGLEPATPCVTGRYSNQLNYRSVLVGVDRLELPTFCL